MSCIPEVLATSLEQRRRSMSVVWLDKFLHDDGPLPSAVAIQDTVYLAAEGLLCGFRLLGCVGRRIGP